MKNQILILLALVVSPTVVWAETDAKQERDAKLVEALKRQKSNGSKGLGGFGAGRILDVSIIQYQNLLSTRVKSNWKWPSPNDGLVAKILISIARDGKISDLSVEQGSGNPTFDEAVLSAIRKADPLPPPPENNYDLFKRVRFTFNSNEN